VFRPGHGACYECSFTEADYQQIALPCARVASRYESEGKVPTMPTVASIVAGVQVQEALKLLDVSRWEARTLISRAFYFNGTQANAEVLSVPRRQSCMAHSTIPGELIEELPEATAAGMTAAQLLQIAREFLGPTADIKLNFDLVVEMRCRECNALTSVLKPLYKLHREELKCLGCGHPSDGFVSDLVTTSYLGAVRPKYREDFLNRPLADLGVPQLDILLGRGPGMKGRYFELTGDAADVLRFQRILSTPNGAEENN